MKLFSKQDDLAVYFEGNALYGDDFGERETSEWYDDEREAYARLGSADRSSYRYVYHALNRFHAYRHLPKSQFNHVLGFGSAYGDELRPILSRLGAITILDPSDAFVQTHLSGVPVSYIKPAPNGAIDRPSGWFDLITCFGVLHHVPNVTYVVGELCRVLAPGGHLLLREPIVSMGDWRLPRAGLTKHERGIPLRLLRELLHSSGLIVISHTLCDFPLTRRMFRVVRRDVYNSLVATWVDAQLSRAFEWHLRYHASNVFQKLRPASAYFVLTKPTQ